MIQAHQILNQVPSWKDIPGGKVNKVSLEGKASLIRFTNMI